jgi:hypothetical protein
MFSQFDYSGGVSHIDYSGGVSHIEEPEWFFTLLSFPQFIGSQFMVLDYSVRNLWEIFVADKRNTCECVRNLTIVAESHILKNKNGSLHYYHFHKITPFIIFFIDFTVLLDTGWK